MTPRMLAILRASPYDSCGTQWGRDDLDARRLVRLGLLEPNPQDPSWYRITEQGEAYLAMLTHQK